MKNVKNSDLSKVLKKKHEGKWVALSPNRDKVIGFSESLTSLAKKVEGQSVVFMKPTASDAVYAF